jgi:hypothetical protein
MSCPNGSGFTYSNTGSTPLAHCFVYLRNKKSIVSGFESDGFIETDLFAFTAASAHILIYKNGYRLKFKG